MADSVFAKIAGCAGVPRCLLGEDRKNAAKSQHPVTLSLCFIEPLVAGAFVGKGGACFPIGGHIRLVGFQDHGLDLDQISIFQRWVDSFVVDFSQSEARFERFTRNGKRIFELNRDLLVNANLAQSIA